MKKLEPPIFVVRKKKKQKKIEENQKLPCSICKRSFKANLIYKHMNVCFMRHKVSGNHSTSSARILLSSELADDKFYGFTTKILGNMMRGDEYHSYIRNDPLLLSFGTLQMQMKETNGYQDISYTLRCIAKLIVEFDRI